MQASFLARGSNNNLQMTHKCIPINLLNYISTLSVTKDNWCCMDTGYLLTFS